MKGRQPFTKYKLWCIQQLPAPLKPTVSDTFHLASPPCTHRNSLISTCAAWEAKNLLSTNTAHSKKTTTTAHQPPYITSPQWRPSGTGNSLLCIAVLLCRSISALQRGTRPGLSSLSPDRGAMHTLSRGVVLTFEAEMGGIITALSAWHTWTRTASSPSPPAGAPRSTELFYWRKVAEWHLRVAASMRLRLVHERRRMGGMRASCRQGE